MPGIKKYKLVLGVLLFVAYGVGIATIAQQTSALKIGDNAPYGPLSDPQGGHVFNIRVREDLGISPEVQLAAYFPAGMQKSEWNSTTLDISPPSQNKGDICFTMEGNGSKYVQVQIGYEQKGGQVIDDYFITKSQVCKEKNGKNSTGTNNNNVLYAKYPLPKFPDGNIDTTTGLYKVTMTIKYGVSASTTYAGHAAFKVKSSFGGTKISHANNELNFPMIGNNASGNAVTTMDLPFALPCSNDNGTVPKNIRIYEADNGLFSQDLRIRVFKTYDGNKDKVLNSYEEVQFAPGSAVDGQLSNDRLIFTPSKGSGNKGVVTLNMGKKDKYILRIVAWNEGNAINVGVPGASIYGDEEVCVDKSGWNIEGESTVDGIAGTVVKKPGQTAEFRHNLKNIGSAKSESMSVQIGRTGPLKGDVVPTKNIAFDGKEQRYFPGNNATNPYLFTVPANAANGALYCQFIRWGKDSSENKKPDQTGSNICVKVKKDDPGTKYIQLTPKVVATEDTETQTKTSFDGSVTVSEFPKAQDGGWGYNQLTSQPKAVQQTATKSKQNSNVQTRYVCPSGYSPSISYSPTSCAKPYSAYYTCPSGGSLSGSSCLKPASYNKKKDKYSCPSGGTLSGTSCKTAAKYNPPGYTYTSATTQYNYTCAKNGSKTGWTSGGSTCQILYVCEDGATGGGWFAHNAAAPKCNRWECSYSGATKTATKEFIKSTSQPSCSYRCKTSPSSSVWADPAYYNMGNQFDKSWPGATSEKVKCYVQPSFQLTCRWLAPNDIVVKTFTVKVDKDGTYCVNTATSSAKLIGARVCAIYTADNPDYPGGWAGTTPLPGYVLNKQTNKWDWNPVTPANDCTNVIGKPYLAVYGGDVKVGGGVGETLTSCPTTPASNAGISTFSNSGGSDFGAGAEGGVTARGLIGEFVSGRFNTNFSDKRKPLTFANTGSGYGGNFGGGIACTGFIDNTIAVTSGTTLQPVNLANGGREVRRYNGNVYIGSNVELPENWGNSVTNAPLFQLLVKGNIYIGANVSRIDGLYAATGNIYTCATGPGSPATSGTFQACKSQLVVNGALAANKISWLRDCGSVIYAQSTDTAPAEGGQDKERCSSNNAAAEVINYSAEQWIRSAAPDPDYKYDAISSLPPVL